MNKNVALSAESMRQSRKKNMNESPQKKRRCVQSPQHEKAEKRRVHCSIVFLSLQHHGEEEENLLSRKEEKTGKDSLVF
jgi:hypothetical protein